MSCPHKILIKVVPDLYMCAECEEEFDINDL